MHTSWERLNEFSNMYSRAAPTSKYGVVLEPQEFVFLKGPSGGCSVENAVQGGDSPNKETSQRRVRPSRLGSG